MTEHEFDVIVKGLRAAYPNSRGFLEDNASRAIWFRFLGKLDYSTVEMAAYKHIATVKFPPTIAELLEQCSNMTMDLTKNWLDGWNMVQRAIGKYGIYQEEAALKALEDQDPTTASIVRRMGWKSLCLSEEANVDRANFRMVYERTQEREKEMAKLPQNVQLRIEELAKRFVLGDRTA